MKIICSWCKKLIGEKEPIDDPSETHAKCAQCLKKQADESRQKIVTPREDDYPPRTFSFSDEFLEKSREFWESRYGHSLTLEDLREIANNLSGLFTLLAD